MWIVKIPFKCGKETIILYIVEKHIASLVPYGHQDIDDYKAEPTITHHSLWR